MASFARPVITAPEAVSSSCMNSEKVASDSSTAVPAPASPATTRTPSSHATHVNASPFERNASEGAPHRSLRTRCPLRAISAGKSVRWKSWKE